jgi:TIR domain
LSTGKKVFISWSGELSKQLAGGIRQWLPQVLQFTEPYFTPDDVQKGALWDSVMAKELELASFCIIALTRESLNSLWIMFEAGAISNKLDKGRVCPIVFDLKPTEIEGPLSRFQAVRFNQEEILLLIKSINKAAGEDGIRDEQRIINSFNMWWPELDKAVNKILDQVVPKTTVELRSERDLLEEQLLLMRTFRSKQDEMQKSINEIILAIIDESERKRLIMNYKEAKAYNEAMTYRRQVQDKITESWAEVLGGYSTTPPPGPSDDASKSFESLFSPRPAPGPSEGAG